MYEQGRAYCIMQAYMWFNLAVSRFDASERCERWSLRAAPPWPQDDARADRRGAEAARVESSRSGSRPDDLVSISTGADEMRHQALASPFDVVVRPWLMLWCVPFPPVGGTGTILRQVGLRFLTRVVGAAYRQISPKTSPSIRLRRGRSLVTVLVCFYPRSLDHQTFMEFQNQLRPLLTLVRPSPDRLRPGASVGRDRVNRRRACCGERAFEPRR
jgi:hypothetical protein